MENNTLEIIKEMIDQQLNDPQAIRMADGTTFVYRFALTTDSAVALGLDPATPQADITLDLMMEFMTVIGLDSAGNKIADGEYPTDVKGPFIRRIFELYGQKVKAQEAAEKAATKLPEDENPVDEAEKNTVSSAVNINAALDAAKVSAALSQLSMEELMGMPMETENIPNAKPADMFTGEESLATFFKSESVKQVRRFYLNYPASGKDGSPIHLYIETEVDEDDSSYLNYWVGCEEYTAKKYIASCQADLHQEMPLEIVKVKHLNVYIEEIQKHS